MKSQGNILVVDDKPANLRLLTQMLKELGYKVRPVPNGRLALKAALNDLPDLMLLDIMMPEMNGYEVLQRIKKDEALCNIRVIMISGVTEVETIVRCIEGGADDYITKPFKSAILKAKVNACLDKKRFRDRERELYERLKLNYEKLQRAEQDRDGLFSMIVHDLNNPLAGILGNSEFLLRNADKDSIDRDKIFAGLRKICNLANKMTSLVREILDVSKMEAGKMPVSLAAVNAVALVRDLSERFRIQSEMSGVRISFLSEIDNGMVMADKEILFRVLQNLLGNAIKHTPRETNVTCSVIKQENDIILSVADNGPGIAEEYRDKIFEKFFQVNGRGGGKKYGIGLGLAFCKMAIEAQNGRIWVESKEGEGACFKVSLKAYGT